MTARQKMVAFGIFDKLVTKSQPVSQTEFENYVKLEGSVIDISNGGSTDECSANQNHHTKSRASS